MICKLWFGSFAAISLEALGDTKAVPAHMET
jgi:hypothetical protein